MTGDLRDRFDSGPSEEAVRRFKAKRHNEQLKAFYGFMNALGAAVILTALIAPSILGTKIASEVDQPGWVFIGVVIVGQVALRIAMRRED